AFRPIRYLLMATGRFPLSFLDKKEGLDQHESSFKKFNGVYFIIISILGIFILLLTTINLMYILLSIFGSMKNLSKSCEHELLFEFALIDRNIFPIIIFISTLCQFTWESINIFYKRKYFAKYLFVWKAYVWKSFFFISFFFIDH